MKKFIAGIFLQFTIKIKLYFSFIINFYQYGTTTRVKNLKLSNLNEIENVKDSEKYGCNTT